MTLVSKVYADIGGGSIREAPQVQ